MRPPWCFLFPLLLVAVPGRSQEALDRLWSQRDGPGGLDRALAALEDASRAEAPSALVFERLVRLRFFLGNRSVDRDSPSTRALWNRCVSDGLRGLALHGASGGLPIGDVPDLDRLRDRLVPGSIGILFWTTLCYGNTIPGMSLFRQASGAARFRRLVQRCLSLDETYFQAGPHRVYAEFLHEAPALMGGDDDLAIIHAEAAVRLFPDWAENRLCRAQNVWRPRGDRSRWRQDLEAALAVSDDRFPDGMPEQRSAKEEARRLLSEFLQP